MRAGIKTAGTDSYNDIRRKAAIHDLLRNGLRQLMNHLIAIIELSHITILR